jgi:hypothetical protein
VAVCCWSTVPEHSNQTPKLVALVSLALAVVSTVAQRFLYQSRHVFQSVSIGGPDDAWIEAELAKQTRQFQGHQRSLQVEMIAVTAVVCVLLYLLFRQRGITRWTRWVIVASATASLAGLFLAW